jgi:hypothetical protein
MHPLSKNVFQNVQKKSDINIRMYIEIFYGCAQNFVEKVYFLCLA